MMKYIEEYFEDAKVLYLTNNEIKHLNNFLREQINIESVEGIILIPEYKEIDRRYYNDAYCSMDIKVIAHNDQKDLEEIERSISKVRCKLPYYTTSYIPTNEFKFSITDINKFTSDSIIIKSWNERDLLSSYILFDRNGNIEKLQNELKVNKNIWGGLSKIGNIDELSMEPSKKKVLSINK